MLHTAIGSNSPGYGIDQMTAGLQTTARMFNVHCSMPAHTVPMVEVALGVHTRPSRAEAVCRLIEATRQRAGVVVPLGADRLASNARWGLAQA